MIMERRFMPVTLFTDLEHFYPWLRKWIMEDPHYVGANSEGRDLPQVDYMIGVMEAFPAVIIIDIMVNVFGEPEDDLILLNFIEETQDTLNFILDYPPDMYDFALQLKSYASLEFSKERAFVLPTLPELEIDPDRRAALKKKKTPSESKARRLQTFLWLYTNMPELSQERLAARATEFLIYEIQEVLKKAHPDWDEARLTQEASRLFTEEYHRNAFTEYDVRNDFRRIGIVWGKRARLLK